MPLPRHSCPSDGSLFTYLCSGDVSGGSGIVNRPRRRSGGIAHCTPNPCLFSLPSRTHVRCLCANPLESIARASPSRPGDTAITNCGRCDGGAVRPFPSRVFHGQHCCPHCHPPLSTTPLSAVDSAIAHIVGHPHRHLPPPTFPLLSLPLLLPLFG